MPFYTLAALVDLVERVDLVEAVDVVEDVLFFLLLNISIEFYL